MIRQRLQKKSLFLIQCGTCFTNRMIVKIFLIIPLILDEINPILLLFEK